MALSDSTAHEIAEVLRKHVSQKTSACCRLSGLAARFIDRRP